jgi:hypothetical protein
MTPGNADSKDIVYQTSFDTVKDQWSSIQLPFDQFFHSRQTTIDYSPSLAIPARGKQTYSLGFVFSKFEYNERLNAKFLREEFQLDVESIKLYRHPRPVFLLVSSGGAERVNRLSAEQRARDIPIVQLNPQVRALMMSHVLSILSFILPVQSFALYK